MTPPRAFVFDAYGTLFDVHSVVELCDKLWPGKGLLLSQLWRAKQLEYSWLRSLMRRYQDFSKVTEAALGYACAALTAVLIAARLWWWPDWTAWPTSLRVERLLLLIAAAGAAYFGALFAGGFRLRDLHAR